MGRLSLLLVVTTLGCLACSGSERTGGPGSRAGSGADAATRDAGASSAGGGGSKSMNASSGSGAMQATGGTTAGAGGVSAGAGGRMSTGSGGSNSQQSDAGVVQDAGASADASISNPASCPATYAQLQAAPSPCASSQGCAYPEGYCSCFGRCSGIAPNPNDPPVPASWSCKPPQEGCPPGIPVSGSECDEDGRTCSYGGCCIQLVTCRSGRWNVGLLMCPP